MSSAKTRSSSWRSFVSSLVLRLVWWSLTFSAPLPVVSSLHDSFLKVCFESIHYACLFYTSLDRLQRMDWPRVQDPKVAIRSLCPTEYLGDPCRAMGFLEFHSRSYLGSMARLCPRESLSSSTPLLDGCSSSPQELDVPPVRPLQHTSGRCVAMTLVCFSRIYKFG